MHKFYVFKNARVKKGEKIMFTEKDLRCDGSELRYQEETPEAIFSAIKSALDKGDKVKLKAKDKWGFIGGEKLDDPMNADITAIGYTDYSVRVVVNSKTMTLINKNILNSFYVVITQQVVPAIEKVNIDEASFDDEVDHLIQSRSNGTYNEIADDAGDIISILEDDMRFNYFFAQIANKLARIKHRYSVEDSLLDIAGYAKLELDRLRNEKDQ